MNNDDWKDMSAEDIFVNLDNDYIIDTSNISTTNVTDSSTMSSWSSDTITIGNNPNTTFTISGENPLKFDNDITFTTHEPVDFVDQLPTLNKINAMCAEYPGLNKAFDNFKVTYKMVHQDWMGKKKAND